MLSTLQATDMEFFRAVEFFEENKTRLHYELQNHRNSGGGKFERFVRKHYSGIYTHTHAGLHEGAVSNPSYQPLVFSWGFPTPVCEDCRCLKRM